MLYFTQFVLTALTQSIRYYPIAEASFAGPPRAARGPALSARSAGSGTWSVQIHDPKTGAYVGGWGGVGGHWLCLSMREREGDSECEREGE